MTGDKPIFLLVYLPWPKELFSGELQKKQAEICRRKHFKPAKIDQNRISSEWLLQT